MLGELQSQQPPGHKRRRRVNLPITILLSLVLIVILPMIEPRTKSLETATARSSITPISNENASGALLAVQENTIVATAEPTFVKQPLSIMNGVIVTGYSSTTWQTDETPFITASGSWVRDGIVAANFLAFGTKIRIPEVYGNKVFTVEDRMHHRNSYNVDIWFDNYWQAKNFGVVRTSIEIVD